MYHFFLCSTETEKSEYSCNSGSGLSKIGSKCIFWMLPNYFSINRSGQTTSRNGLHPFGTPRPVHSRKKLDILEEKWNDPEMDLDMNIEMATFMTILAQGSINKTD